MFETKPRIIPHNTKFIKTLLAFRPYYGSDLSIADSLEIKNNIGELLKIFSDNKRYLIK